MSKRTLEGFFAPTPAVKKRKTEQDASDVDKNASLRPASTHATYPFPISQLPINVEDALLNSPFKPAREVNNQPDLDLLYFEPYFASKVAKQLFEFLRRELFFYRVQYKIKRYGKDTEVNTPRL